METEIVTSFIMGMWTVGMYLTLDMHTRLRMLLISLKSNDKIRDDKQ